MGNYVGDVARLHVEIDKLNDPLVGVFLYKRYRFFVRVWSVSGSMHV